MNLNTVRYKAYKKPNNELLYVCKGSNHPINVKKEIPAGIEIMLNSRRCYKNYLGT